MNRIHINRDTALQAACVALVVLGAAPIVFSWNAMPTVQFFHDLPRVQLLGYLFSAIMVASSIAVVALLDPERGKAKAVRTAGFVLVAALLTDLHYYTCDVFRFNWQIEQYNGIFAHTYQAPDQYRFIPQGILWWMMLCNGDIGFSYLAYRFLFTFLVCVSIYHFARIYLAPRDAIAVVLVYALFYPLSTRYYYGNMLDPMSHAIMLATLTYCYRRKFICVLFLMVAGTAVKETMLVLAPCYWLMNLDRSPRPTGRDLARVAALGVAGMVVFFACRLPFHFSYTFQSLNRTTELMIYSNLGMARGMAQSTVSVFQRYLHPVLFIFMWFPLIIARRRMLTRSLFCTGLYVSVAIYLTSLCFSWNYESRNFIPAFVVLITATIVIINASLRLDVSSPDPTDHLS